MIFDHSTQWPNDPVRKYGVNACLGKQRPQHGDQWPIADWQLLARKPKEADVEALSFCDRLYILNASYGVVLASPNFRQTTDWAPVSVVFTTH